MAQKVEGWITDTHALLFSAIARNAKKLIDESTKWRIQLNSDDIWVINFKVWKNLNNEKFIASSRSFRVGDISRFKGSVEILVREEILELINQLDKECQKQQSIQL